MHRKANTSNIVAKKKKADYAFWNVTPVTLVEIYQLSYCMTRTSSRNMYMNQQDAQNSCD